jgi:hypothetical protein
LPRLPIDLHDMVRKVLGHTSPLPPQANCPIKHFETSNNVGHLLITYINDHIDIESVYESVYHRHLGHLRRMVLAEQIESFERFLKELAAICVDFLAPYTTDDRYDEFIPKRGEQIAASVNANSIGKALCESDTWLRNKTINDRFRSLLKAPSGDDWEYLFPDARQQPVAERSRAQTLALLWQVRHSLAHNVGVITHSDSMRFRVLTGGPVEADCRLSPSTEDLRYVKRFLMETAARTNRRVGTRLAELLEVFHKADAGVFDAQEKADRVSWSVDFSVTINGRAGAL